MKTLWDEVSIRAVLNWPEPFKTQWSCTGPMKHDLTLCWPVIVQDWVLGEKRTPWMIYWCPHGYYRWSAAFKGLFLPLHALLAWWICPENRQIHITEILLHHVRWDWCCLGLNFVIKPFYCGLSINIVYDNECCFMLLHEGVILTIHIYFVEFLFNLKKCATVGNIKLSLFLNINLIVYIFDCFKLCASAASKCS